MLAKDNRFHGHGSLAYLYKNGTAIRSHLVVIKYLKNPRRTTSRIAVVISKKVHKSAVGRNLIRRRIYEIIRQELPRFSGIYDVAIIVVSGEAIAATHEELDGTLKDLLKNTPLITPSEVI